MLIWAVPSPVSAEIGSARVHGPDAGESLVELADQIGSERIGDELREALEEGSDAFRDANFGAAVDWYELAERLAPEGSELKAQIRAMVRISSEKRFLQGETRKHLPGDEDELEDRYKATYSQAKSLYKDHRYEDAYRLFHDLWLVSGDFKGTLKYMHKTREKGDLSRVALSDVDPDASEILRRQASASSQPELAPLPEEPEAPANDIDELILQAQVEAQAGRIESSRQIYEQALAMEPGNPVVQRGLDHLKQLEAGQEEKELQLHIEDLVEQARRHEADQDWSAAEAAYREALELAPASNEISGSLARVLEEQEAAAEAVAAPPAETPASGALKRAQAAIAEGNFEEAQAAFEEVLELEPENREAMAGLREIAARREDDAARELDRTIELALQQGESFLDQGLNDSARSAFETALTLDPGNARAQAGLRKLRSGDVDGASEAYANPVSENPASTPRERRVAQAETMSEEVPAARPSGEEGEAVSESMAPQEPVSSPPAPMNEPPARQAQDVAAPVQQAAPSQPQEEEGGGITGWFRGIFSGDDDEPAATRGASHAASSSSSSPPPSTQTSSRQSGDPQVNTLLEEARYQYEVERNLEAARQKWEWVLEIDPGNKMAQTYLAETEDEYQQYLATREQQEMAAEQRRAQEELLRSPLTIQTDRPTALSEFMRLISFSTTEEIEYYIADGAETPVFVNFVDRPLAEVLDAVLLPVGLTWSMDENGLITIETDLRHNAFRLTESQVSQVRSLLQSGRMQTAIWGQPDPPSKGIEMTLDERQRVLLVVGSRLHLQKVEDLLSSLDSAERPTLDTAFYKIREQDGPKIKSLINAVVTADQGSPFEMDRRIFLDGDDLIIRDTPENLTKIEELLLDQNFIQKMRDEDLEITNFNLAPKDFETTPRDVIDTFTSRIVVTIKTLLYAKTGEEAAAAQGRRMFFDNATYQLTIIDTPTNLARVGNYLNSLPELRRRRQQQVIFLEHAVAEAMASDLVSILGLRGAVAGVEAGETVVKRLSRGDEFTFRDLRIRVVRIEENNEDDREDDSVELNIITGTNSSNVTLRELDTTFFENYELTAEDVQPTGNQEDNPGEGVARVLVRYVGDVEEQQALAEEEIQREQEIQEEAGVSIFPFGQLNALIVRYENPAVLQDIQDLISQLDLPTPQVEVETKFVQVNEQRAREFSADFGLENLVNGAGSLNSDFFNFNSGFGRPQDEVRPLGDVPLENPWAANLLNGTTVLDFILGTGVPGLSFQLRMLEAEGVLNIVNGPKVTMLDNEQGEFRIERGDPYPDTVETGNFDFFTGSRTEGGQAGSPGESLNISDDFSDTQGSSLANDDAGSLSDAMQAVVLIVTPQITSEKSIIFDITAELLDLDNFIGQQAFVGTNPFENDFFPFIEDDRQQLLDQMLAAQQAQVDLINQLSEEGTPPSPELVDALAELLSGTVTSVSDVVASINPFQDPELTGGPFQEFSKRVRNNRIGPFAQLGLFTPGQMMRTRKLIITRARSSDGGTIVLGGWTGERTIDSTSGVPVLRNMPYIGKLFTRNSRSSDRTTLLIFLTSHILEDSYVGAERSAFFGTQ